MFRADAMVGLAWKLGEPIIVSARRIDMTFRETDEDVCSTVAAAPEEMRFRFIQGLRYDG